jgi:predicted nucleic acid-binding protein
LLRHRLRRDTINAADGESRESVDLGRCVGDPRRSNRTLWQGALVRAHHSTVAVYDTRFVELAVREGLPLVTFDAAVLKAFPDIAVRPARLTPE